ncbi:MAG: hypothetical protein ACT4QC_05635 [Planctomycetaceae bacterium]
MVSNSPFENSPLPAGEGQGEGRSQYSPANRPHPDPHPVGEGASLTIFQRLGGFLLGALRHLDRRWIFLAMLLAVALPILAQATFPEQPTYFVQRVFDKVEGLPDGSTVLIAFDYDPATEGELGPMAVAFVRHCCLKRHKMLLLTLFETGVPVLEQTVRQVIESEFAGAGLTYGEDYINLGFSPGREAVIATSVLNLRQSISSDHEGTSLDDFPLTRNITNLQDVDLILDLSAGYPGFKEWVQYAASPYQIAMAAGTTAVGAPQAYPYLPDQMLGLLAAIKGAAEYEAALAGKYPQFRDPQGAPDPRLNEGIRRMAPQFWGHLLVIFLIVLGNAIYLAERWMGAA